MDQQVKDSDKDAIEAIHALLSGGEWDSETIEHVARIVTATGRTIEEPEDEDEEDRSHVWQCHICLRDFEATCGDSACSACGRPTCDMPDCGVNGEGECAECGGATETAARWAAVREEAPPIPHVPCPNCERVGCRGCNECPHCGDHEGGSSCCADAEIADLETRLEKVEQERDEALKKYGEVMERNGALAMSAQIDGAAAGIIDPVLCVECGHVFSLPAVAKCPREECGSRQIRRV